LSNNRPMLFARLDPKDFDEARRIADEEYDGNLSLLVRIAVKRFIDALRGPKVDRDEPEAKVAA
jgi:hypothetical protein